MRIAAIWSVVLTALLLGPALGPGFVLTYDMVWVPDLRVGLDAWGLGSALPRAVPSDAVVGILDEVVPGAWLQTGVLAGTLVGGGLGAARLVVGLSTAARLAAVTVWIWNPFVVERLVMGHWPVLVGYAVLPWLAAAAMRWARGGPGARSAALGLAALLPIGSLSASAGLASAVVVLAFGLRRSWRRDPVLLVLLVAANLPWVVSGLAHRATATSAAEGFELFALAGEGGLPPPLTALGLGGVWNSEVLPDSREGLLVWVALVALVALAALGSRSWWRATDARTRTAYLVGWGFGWGIAVLTWLAPGALGSLAAAVPGVGLLRDGSRLLGLCALLVVVLVAHGVERIVRSDLDRVPRLVLAAGLVVHPIAVLPDAAWGVAGRLAPVSYPAEYAHLRAAVGDAEGAHVVLLPFSAFRAPAWNGGRTVLDPLARYLRPDAVTNDELVVSGRTLAGEDPRAAAVARALQAPTADARSRELAALGIGFVVVDRTAPGPAPDLAGRPIFAGPTTSALALPGPVADPPRGAWRPGVVTAWAAFGATLLGGLLGGPVVALTRRLRERPR